MMNGKQIRRKLERAQRQKQKIEGELSTCQAGPLSREDKAREIKDAFDKLAEHQATVIRAALIGKPTLTGGSLAADTAKAKAEFVPSLQRGFNAAGIVHEMGKMSTFGTSDPLAFLPALALLGREQLEAECNRVLDSLPDSVFGTSQAERDKREAKLRDELAAVEAEITALGKAWVEEVGDNVPMPA